MLIEVARKRTSVVSRQGATFCCSAAAATVEEESANNTWVSLASLNLFF